MRSLRVFLFAITLSVLSPSFSAAQDGSGYEALTKEAIALARDGMFTEAIVKAREAHRVAVEFAGKDSWIAAVSGSNLGEMLRRQGALQEAREILTSAVATGQNAPEHDDEVLISMKNSLAALYLDNAEYARADTLYSQNRAALTELGKQDSEQMAMVISDVAELKRRQADTVTAEALYKESISISEANGNTATVFLGYRYTNLGLLLADRGEFESAATMLEKALAILGDSLPADNSDLVNTTLNLAQIKANIGFTKMSVGDYAAADPYLKSSIITIERLQPTYPGLSQLYEAYSVVLFQTDRLDEAKVYKDKIKK